MKLQGHANILGNEPLTTGIMEIWILMVFVLQKNTICKTLIINSIGTSVTLHVLVCNHKFLFQCTVDDQDMPYLIICNSRTASEQVSKSFRCLLFGNMLLSNLMLEVRHFSHWDLQLDHSVIL